MSLRNNYSQHSHDALKALITLDKTLAGSPVGAGILLLVRLRVSQINGCIFCLDMHAKEARLHGDRELRLHHVALWRESPLFDGREKAALEWAERVTSPGPEGVSDEAYAKARECFSEKELSDLTFAVASINAWNRIGVAFRPTPGSMDKLLGLDKTGLV